MGISNPQSINLTLQTVEWQNKVVSGALKPTTLTTYNLPTGNYESSSNLLLQRMYPMEDGLTHQYSHHRCAHPGMAWECPVRAMGGSNPRFYELVSGPSGMTIGQWLEPDANGDYVITPAYGKLSWPNPVVGTYRIVVRCTDMYGRYITIAWTLTCALGLHLFMAPIARGAEDGSSYANAISETTVVGNSNTAPALNKVLVACGGTYASVRTLRLNKNTGAGSLIGYPGETAIWQNRIEFENADCSVGFMTISNVGVPEFGVIIIYGGHNRLATFYNTFTHCFNSDSGISNNQCLIGYASTGANGSWRKNIVHLNNTYIDCDQLHAFDCFSIDSLLVQCEKWITTANPGFSLTTQARAVWFTKSFYNHSEISFNTYDNPHVTGRAGGIIQLYNGIAAGFTQLQNSISVTEYNFIRCSNTEASIGAGGASNLNSGNALASMLTLTNIVQRNTVINGNISIKNYDYPYNVNRRTFLYNNVVQTSGGNNVTVTPLGGVDTALWFDNPSSLFGNNLTDINGKLNSSYIVDVGKKGCQVKF